MNITLYKYSGDPRVVNKSLESTSSTISVIEPYEALDELRGSIIIAGSAANESANYCLLNGRYYYIEDRIKDTAGRLRLNLREDVLMTLKNKLYKLSAVFDRVTTTTLMQATIPDNLPLQSYRMTSEYTSSHLYTDFHFGDPTGVNDLDFIVVLGGKGGL